MAELEDRSQESSFRPNQSTARPAVEHCSTKRPIKSAKTFVDVDSRELTVRGLFCHCGAM